jgi:hypothetical protein
MPATIDTRKAHLTRQHGDIIAVYTWVNDTRAMILIPANRPGAPWFIVMEPAAYEYADDRELARRAVKACEVLGLEPSKPNWVRVATIILEGLPDLIEMPSAPPPDYLKGAIGQMILKEAGKVIAGEDIRLEDEGVTYG